MAENAGLDIADRFLTNTEADFNNLAGQPLIGVLLTLRHPALAGMRKWRIKDFENHLVFYLPNADGVSMVRVLHVARDWLTKSIEGLLHENPNLGQEVEAVVVKMLRVITGLIPAYPLSNALTIKVWLD